MAKYINNKCGNCKYSFTGGYTPGYNSLLGVSRIKCPKCSAINRTLSKPYSKFSFEDYISFWVGRIIRIILLGLMYGFLLAYLLGLLINSESDYIFFSGVTLGLVGNVIFNYYSIRYEINSVEEEEAKFVTPEMEKQRLRESAKKRLSRVQNLNEKLASTFPEFDPSKSYDPFQDQENNLELHRMQWEHSNKFEVLTWPIDRHVLDDDGNIYREDIALYINKKDKNKFIENKLNFIGPVYIREDLAFDKDGKLLLYGYFEHPKTHLLLQQAKDNLSLGIKEIQPGTSNFVI